MVCISVLVNAKFGSTTMLEVEGYSKEMNKESIKKVKSFENKQRGLVKDFKEVLTNEIEAPDALDIMLRNV